MANQRPIRRPPLPRWRRGKKRPTRWNASTNGVGGIEFQQVQWTNVPNVGPGQTEGPTAILADGQIDVEPWADDQEVTIDRVILGIRLWAYGSHNLDTNLFIPPIMIKAGLILLEETTAETPAPLVQFNLFDQETIEDAEWIWLHTHLLEVDTYRITPPPDPTGYATHTYNIDVDIRNRRKIGQKDELALYVQYAPGNATGVVAHNVESYTDSRIILMSR